MSDPHLAHQLIHFAESLGTLVENAQKELGPDQFRVIESNAHKALATLQRLAQQCAHLEDQYSRFKGKSPRRRQESALILQFKPTKRRPSRGPGSNR